MLSSTAPLTEAQGYDTSTVKVIILMTDGENTVNGYDDSSMNKADRLHGVWLSGRHL